MKAFAPILMSLALPLVTASAGEGNQVVDFESIVGKDAVLTLSLQASVPLYDTQAAQRVLAALPAKQDLTVLAMDKFGLRVRGEAKNGPLTGWISQKAVLSEEQRTALAALHARQMKVDELIERKQAAIGMTMEELTRALGPATSHEVVAADSGRKETASWVKTQKVDLNDQLDLGTDTALLKVDVEVGRITAEFENGVACSIKVNLEGVAPEVATVPAPVALPFERQALAGVSR